jgi:hypothetical protein
MAASQAAAIADEFRLFCKADMLQFADVRRVATSKAVQHRGDRSIIV